MKIPKIFAIDRKNLDQKVQTYLEESLQEETLTPLELLYKGLNKDDPEFGGKRSQLINDAFEKILDDTYNGLVQWEKSPKSLEERYTAEASVFNARGREITLPILFFVKTVAERTDYLYRIGWLCLGSEEGPCLNTVDKKIEKLAQDYFKIVLLDNYVEGAF